jgi:hypothetical protein
MLRICSKCGDKKYVSKWYRPKEKNKKKKWVCSRCRDKKYIIKKEKRHQNFKPGTREYRRDNFLMFMYGISLMDYNALVLSQNNRCKICGKHRDEQKNDLHVDHNHVTNEIRGLLCQDCNMALGYVHDNIDILLNAIRYLEK